VKDVADPTFTTLGDSRKPPRVKNQGKFLAVNTDNYSWLPDGSVDFILTDPPFNIARDTNFHTYSDNKIHSYRFDGDSGWDTYSHEDFVALLGDWSAEFGRVLRKGGTFAIFCADAYISHFIDALRAAGLSPKRVLTWRKPNAVPVNRKSLMMSACEYVIVGVKGSNGTFNSDILVEDDALLREVGSVMLADKAGSVVDQAVRDSLASLSPSELANGDRVAEVVEAAVQAAAVKAGKKAKAMYVSDEISGVKFFRACVPNYVAYNSKGGKRQHPTEKPVNILRFLTALLSHPGDVILDPFAGSGSTGEAALGLGRQVILVEQDKEYYSGLSKRLKALAKNLN